MISAEEARALVNRKHSSIREQIEKIINEKYELLDPIIREKSTEGIAYLYEYITFSTSELNAISSRGRKEICDKLRNSFESLGYECFVSFKSPTVLSFSLSW